MRLDQSAKDLVKTLAPAQLVFTDHFTINKADRIFGKSQIETFSTKASDLRPLSHNDTFVCTDYSIVFSGGKAHVRVRMF